MKLINFLLSEHNYSLREGYSSHLKPTRNLFPPVIQPPPLSKRASEEIDVTTIPSSPPLEYNVTKSMRRMDECEQFVIFARFNQKDEEELQTADWEETISKVGWSYEQMDLFKRVVQILHSDRLSRLALADSWSEPAKKRVFIDRTAQRFRDVLTYFKWDVRLTQWLHGLLTEHLHFNYLTAYIDILQTLKCRIPTLIDRLLAGSIYGKAPAVQQGMDLLLKRPWYPAIPSLSAKKLGKLPGNPVFVLVHSTFKKNSKSTPRSNFWAGHLSTIATLVVVGPLEVQSSSKMTPLAYLEQMVSLTKARLALVRSEFPGRPVVIIGWRSGAAVALQAAATEPVSAAVTLGFATRTVDGPRGEPDDSIYNLTCPVLFVTGENAYSSRPEDLEEIRSKMTNVTGLIVVGSSDDCLRMKRRQKVERGIPQSLVDRAVLEAVGDFLADVLLQPNAPSRVDRSQMMSSLAFTQRKRCFSNTSSIDSETAVKQFRGNCNVRVEPTGAYKSVNGNNNISHRRGRKPGSLNKNPRTSKIVKKIQTLSPVKKIKSDPIRSNDVTLDVGSIASLTPTGPITRSPQNISPSASMPANLSSESSTPLQTYRIHAGRVSATSAPPADVMPLRPNDGTNAIIKDEIDESKSPIMTLTSIPRSSNTSIRPIVQTVRSPSSAVRSSLSPAKQSSPLARSGARFNMGSKLVGAQRNVIMMTDQRLVSSSSSTSGSIKLTTSPTKVIKSPVNQLKTASRLSLTKRLVTTSSPLQQKPIIVKSRAARPDNESEHVKMMIVKPEEKSKFVLKRSGNDTGVPLMIIKNRSIMTEDIKSDGFEGTRNKIGKESKRLVLASGEEYLISQSTSPKYLLKSADNNEFYEVNYP